MVEVYGDRDRNGIKGSQEVGVEGLVETKVPLLFWIPTTLTRESPGTQPGSISTFSSPSPGGTDCRY